MSKHPFSEEEIRQFRINPYTYSVTPHQISFTAEFKELFFKKYTDGVLPSDIFRECGYSVETLGVSRIAAISCYIRKEYEQYGSFHDASTRREDYTQETDESRDRKLRRLEHEVDYLKQELEFLKKISTIRTTKK